MTFDFNFDHILNRDVDREVSLVNQGLAAQLRGLVLLPAILLAVAGCSNQLAGSYGIDVTGEGVAGVKASGIELKIAAVAGGEHRSEKNRARNQYRHPVETLAFFGLSDDMTVIEISPGGLWYTEILAPLLKDNGRFIAAGYDVDVPGQPAYRYRQTQEMLQRFAAEPEHYANAGVVAFSPPQSSRLGPNASADRVLTFRNSHGWMRDGIAEKVYQAAFDALKPGGIFGVVQHRGDNRWLPADSDKEVDRKISGYLPEAVVIAAAESVGFVLEEKSEINANPRDTQDHPAGVWTLPPSLRLKEVDLDKYLAIGESDRMTLRFRKP